MSNQCVVTAPFCVVRGTTFTSDVSFTTAWTEVIENPTDYTGQMVFRDSDSSSAKVYLTLTSPISTDDPEAPAQLHFEATPTQTLLLPTWDVVLYCNLLNNTGDPIVRLFDGEVTINE